MTPGFDDYRPPLAPHNGSPLLLLCFRPNYKAKTNTSLSGPVATMSTTGHDKLAAGPAGGQARVSRPGFGGGCFCGFLFS
jgi:hypothetical protein